MDAWPVVIGEEKRILGSDDALWSHRLRKRARLYTGVAV